MTNALLATRDIPRMKYSITRGYLLQLKIFIVGGIFIMQKNRTLAMDVLRREVRRTRIWRTAFIVAFAVVVIDRIVGKAGASNEQ